MNQDLVPVSLLQRPQIFKKQQSRLIYSFIMSNRIDIYERNLLCLAPEQDLIELALAYNIFSNYLQEVLPLIPLPEHKHKGARICHHVTYRSFCLFVNTVVLKDY